MKKFDIKWIGHGIYQHITIEAETKEEAIKKFYNMAADTAFVVECEEICDKK